MSLFRSNLDTKGRLIRGTMAVALAGGTVLTWPHFRVASIICALFSAFTAFEAARGWCALRACGVKTKY